MSFKESYSFRAMQMLSAYVAASSFCCVISDALDEVAQISGSFDEALDKELHSLIAQLETFDGLLSSRYTKAMIGESSAEG